MRRKGTLVFGQNLKVSTIVLLLLFEALNTPTNKLYDTSKRDDARQSVQICNILFRK